MALGFLLALVEVHNVVMQGRCGERLVRLDAESDARLVRLPPPADVGLRSCFLRADVGEELLVGSLLTQANRHAFLAVCIVLDGAAPVVLALVVVVRHVHHHSEAEHVADLGARHGAHLLGNVDGSAFQDDVGHGEPGLYAWHVVGSLDGHGVLFLLLFGGQRRELHLGVAPDKHALVQTGTHVVVGDGSPEVGSERSTFAQEVASEDCVAVHESRLTVEADHEVVVRDDDAFCALLVENLYL